MSKKMTVREIYPLVKKQAAAAGVCSASDLMVRMNIVAPEILNRIDAKGMLWNWRLCARAGCVALPEDVGGVRTAYFQGQSTAAKGPFSDARPGAYPCEESMQEVPWNEVTYLDQDTATQQLVEESGGMTFAVVAQDRGDAGKDFELRFSVGGQERRWSAQFGTDALAVFNPDPGVGPVHYFRKPRTGGRVHLMAVDPDTGRQERLSAYNPEVECPSYQLVKLSGCGRRPGVLEIHGRKEWAELKDVDDLVPFGSVMVWRELLRAEEASEGGDTIKLEEKLAQAMHFLELEIYAGRPRSQVSTLQVLSPWGVNDATGFHL